MDDTATHSAIAQHKEEHIGHFRHLTSINSFRTHGSVLLLMPKGTAMPLSLVGSLLHSSQLYCRDPRCLQGQRLQGRLQRSRGKYWTTHIPPIAFITSPTNSPVLILYQLQCRGASVPCQQHRGNLLGSMSSFGIFQWHRCCSTQQIFEASSPHHSKHGTRFRLTVFLIQTHSAPLKCFLQEKPCLWTRSSFLVQYQALPSWRNLCHEHFWVHPFLHCHFAPSTSWFWYQFKDTGNVFHFYSHQTHV